MVQPSSWKGANGGAGLEAAFEAAAVLHQQQRLVEAESSYRAILEVDSGHYGALHNLGMLLALRRRFDEAADLLRRALCRDPESVEAHDHLGCALQALGRYEEALAHHVAALAIDPEDAEAHFNLGVALQALNRHEEAIESYLRALAFEPSIAEIHYNVATAYSALKQHQAALDYHERALKIRPDYAQARVGLATTLQLVGRHQESVGHYQKAVSAQPNDAKAHEGLGAALHMIGQHEEAVTEHRKALALKPDYAEAHNSLGLALQALGRHGEALAHHERALAIAPGYAAAHNNLGLALQAINRHEEAIEHFRRAVALRPESAAQGNMGLAFQEIGRIEDARLAFERAVELDPRNARLLRNLADCKTFAPDDPQWALMESLARDVALLPEDEQRQLHFALGKALEDVGEYKRSFQHLLAGNRLMRDRIGYVEPAVLAEFDRIRAAFPQELMAQRAGRGHPSAAPIFILGMPRSGSTLIEQVLASHPSVFGAGERLDFSQEAAGLTGPDGRRFPEVASSLSDKDLRELGARYVRSVSAAAPGAERVTDKLPFNFFFVGLIHLALPNARIIHTLRDPIDTCFSCFSKLFPGEHRGAYELAELGRYYRAYEKLMEHWRAVTPATVMLDVRYEDVVADLEPQARRILDHCGLEWNEGCLDFQGARRPVRTASAVQVRQPVHARSVGRWRPYGDMLAPLLKALID